MGRWFGSRGTNNLDSLVEPSWLMSRLDQDDFRFFDTRFSLQDSDEGLTLYRKGHIPGAVFADLESDLSGKIVPGITGRHPLPPVQELVARLQKWGVSENTRVVIYDEGSHAMASRFWWLLKVWLGHPQVSILHGGFKTWVAQGNPQSSKIPELSVTDYCPVSVPGSVVSTADVESALESDTCLLDARNMARFRGECEPIDPVAGHIPGAECVPFLDNMDRHGRFLSVEQLQQRFQRWQNSENICYCGSGVTACHNIFAMHLAGLPLPKLYAGSWSEWIINPSRPVATD